MNIILTKDDIEQFKKDQYMRIEVSSEDESFDGMYFEFDSDFNFVYGEFGKYVFNNSDLERACMKTPKEEYGDHNFSCPNCYRSLIFNIDFCPFCGQKMDWKNHKSERF